MTRGARFACIPTIPYHTTQPTARGRHDLTTRLLALFTIGYGRRRRVAQHFSNYKTDTIAENDEPHLHEPCRATPIPLRMYIVYV